MSSASHEGPLAKSPSPSRPTYKAWKGSPTASYEEEGPGLVVECFSHILNRLEL